MPYYDFLNEKTGHIKCVFFHMNQEKKYIDDTGYEWIRQFCSPQTAIDTKWDEDNSRSFVEQTKKRQGSIKDLWDKSAELSEKRAKKIGYDPVKVTANEQYKKTHRGQDMPEVKRQKLKEELRNSPLELDE